MWFHFVARAEHPHQPFSDRWTCVRTWRILGRNFPKAMACVLMPNHVHLILESANGAADHGRFKGALSVLGVPWQSIPEARSIPDEKHLWRQIRYVHLNPCRAKIAADPLMWEWSTYRDYMGAAWPQWPDVARVRKNLGWPRSADWAETVHRRTSSDEAVRISGTPPPLIVAGEQSLHGSVDAICTAAARAFRIMPEQLQRRCTERTAVVKYAETVKDIDVYAFGRRFGITTRGLWAMRQRQAPAGAMRSLALVLSDRRLLGEVLPSRTSGAPPIPPSPSKFR